MRQEIKGNLKVEDQIKILYNQKDASMSLSEFIVFLNNNLTVVGASPIAGYEIVACVIRNTGSGWFAIDDVDHTPLNVDSVSNNTSTVEIDYSSIGASEVVSLVACPDETYAGKYDFGASVGVETANISIAERQKRIVRALLTHDGAGNIAVSAQDGVTTATLNAEDNEVTVNHSACNGTMFTMKDMPQTFATEATMYAPSTYSDSTTETKFILKNLDGSDKTLGTPEWKRCRFVREIEHEGLDKVALNPNNVSEATGNVWIFGIMKI